MVLGNLWNNSIEVILFWDVKQLIDSILHSTESNIIKAYKASLICDYGQQRLLFITVVVKSYMLNMCTDIRWILFFLFWTFWSVENIFASWCSYIRFDYLQERIEAAAALILFKVELYRLWVDFTTGFCYRFAELHISRKRPKKWKISYQDLK